MKVIFLGTPDFAVGILDALLQSRHTVAAVVSQPDRAKDRKGRLLPTPVKKRAEEKGLPLYQFEKIRLEGVETLRKLNADAMVTAAYGQILSKEILEIAPYGVLNVHASLLPKYRGSAPVQWAIINGEKETGVTIMRTDVGIDNGDMLAVAKTSIGERETAGQLFVRLREIGAKLLVETLDTLECGKIVPVPQDESAATKCRMLCKEDGHLRFHKSRREIDCLVRGVTPFPGAFAFLDGELIKIGRVSALSGDFGPCGKVSVLADKIVAACADGGIAIEELQPAGKRMMTVKEFLAGHELPEGAVLQ